MHPSKLKLLAISLIIALASVTALHAQWPQFRGPNGSGVGEGTGYPVEFSATKNVAWKAAIPFGQSSPVIVGNRVYVTAREGEQLLTIALDAGSGKEAWRRGLKRTRQMPMYKANDPASPTPSADATGVVSFFADFGLVAYGVDGSVQWTHAMGPFNNFYGMAASPVISDGLVVQLIEQSKDSYIEAIDRRTGAVRWRTNRPSVSTGGYATPIVFRPPAGRTVLVAIGSGRLDGYDLTTGKSVWWTPIATNGSMGVALTDGDTILVSTLGSAEPGLPKWSSTLAQYDKDRDGRLSRAEFVVDKEMGEHFGWIDTSEDKFIVESEWNVASTISMGAWGAVAIKPGTSIGQLPDSAVRWRFQKNVPYIPAPLLYRGVFYMAKSGGIITTLDPATGKLLKEGRATGALGEYTASPVAADGKVYVANQEGKITVLKAGAQWEILAVNDLGDEINATPALAGSRIYVRTRGALFCLK